MLCKEEIKTLVDLLRNMETEIKYFENFFTSFTPDLLSYKLLYQAISRAREKLCVLVVENYKLFSDILNIKFDMLSRYQYKENYTNTTLSVKKLNRFTKKIKDKLSELEKNNAITISETVDIINDELMGAELKKKVVRNGLKLLQLICGKACAGSSIG